MFARLILVMTASLSLAAAERALTTAPHGHQIHHDQAFSADGRWIHFDVRPDETRLAESAWIGRVEVATGRVEVLHRVVGPVPPAPGVGAIVVSPTDGRLAFIQGLPDASPENPYAVHRRCARTLAADGSLAHLDARHPVASPVPGALRGGTHAFAWSPNGRRLSFTYNDATVGAVPAPDDLRTVGVMELARPIEVPAGPGAFSGQTFATVVAEVRPNPAPGTDQLLRAHDEAWVDASRLAFLGVVRAADGSLLTEVFLAELPALLSPSIFPVSGPPRPPSDIPLRRLTRTERRAHPGVQGPRHWVRPSPDRSLVAFLAKDAAGIVQIHAVPIAGGEVRALSRLPVSVDAPFSWTPDGRRLACSAGGRLWVVDAATARAEPLTGPSPRGQEPRHAVLVSPDGKTVATNRFLPGGDGRSHAQIVLVDLPPAAR